MKSKTATLVETVRRTPLFNQLVPQEAGVGWPLPVRPGGRGGALYVTLPFFGLTPDPGGGPTKLYPPFSTLTVRWSNGLPVEYLDLRYRKPWPGGEREGEAGVFPHAAVVGMSVGEYESAKAELFRLCDEMFDRLDRSDPIPGELAEGFGRLLRVLLEPPLEPFYRALAPKFFERFLPADPHEEMNMSTFSEQKQQVNRLLEAAADLARRRETKEVEELFEEAARRLARGELFVVVCGEFKKGKSSLLNALLDEPALFPVDIDITTSLVTTISYAPAERIQVWFRDERRDPSVVIEREQIADYVTEQRNRGNHRRARLLSIQSPKPQLRDGLVLVDTPGVGGLNSEHSDVSYAFIPNADVIIFVTDALAPLSPDELSFVRERVAADHREVLYVLTKIDCEREYELVLEGNRAKLAEALGRSPEEFRIMPVSSRHKLQYLKTGSDEDLADSRFPQFEAELWRLLNESRGRILTLRGVAELGRGLNQLRNPVLAAIEACKSSSQQDLDHIEQQLREAKDRLQQLLEEGANWRARLEYDLTDLKKDLIGRALEEGASAVRKKFEGYLRDDKYLSRPSSVVDAVKSDVSALSSRLFRKMLEQCEQLQGELERSTAVSLSAYSAGPLTLSLGQPNQSGDPERREGIWRKTLEVGRQASFSGTSGGLIGGVLGGIVGGAVGFFAGGVGALAGAQLGAQLGAAIGTVAGMGSGVRKGVEQINEQEEEAARRAIRNAVTPFLNDALRVCRTELDRSFTGMERSIGTEFVNKLTQEKKSLERSLKAFQDMRQLTHAQAGERLRALRESLQEIDALLYEGERLAASILDAAGPTPAPAQDSDDYGDFADV